jgi:threonine/homoserine/homoserine lactone efflux protein
MGDLDRQASVLLAGDVEAEHHVMPLCMCFAALSRDAVANRLLRQMRRRPRLAVVIAAVVVLFGLHLLYQQQRAASLVLRPPAQPSSA